MPGRGQERKKREETPHLPSRGISRDFFSFCWDFLGRWGGVGHCYWGHVESHSVGYVRCHGYEKGDDDVMLVWFEMTGSDGCKQKKVWWLGDKGTKTFRSPHPHPCYPVIIIRNCMVYAKNVLTWPFSPLYPGKVEKAEGKKGGGGLGCHWRFITFLI